MYERITKDLQYYKFCAYGFFKNLRFFDAFLMLFFIDKGISFLQIGILYSIKEITIMVMEIPSGIISDSVGRRKTLILSFLTYIISFLSYYFSDNYIVFIIAMALFALADAFRSGVHKAMIFQYLRVNNQASQKVSYYGNTRSWSQVGSAISALSAGLIVFYFGRYDVVFIASIIPYIIDMILIYSYPTYLDGEATNNPGILLKEKFTNVFKAAYQSVSNMRFLKLLISLTLYTGYYKSVKDYIQPLLVYIAVAIPFFTYLGDEKKTAVTVGIVYFLLFIFSAIISRYSGYFANMYKNSSKPMNITLTVGLVIGLATGISYNLGLFLIPLLGFVLIIATENLRKPIGIGHISDISKDESMATVLSITSQVKSALSAIIAPIIGFIADSYSPGIGIAVVSIMLLLLIPIYWLSPNN